MDNIKQITGKTNSIAIASAINKALRPLLEHRSNAGSAKAAAPTNELELLKSLCKSDSAQTAHLAVQALVQLVVRGTLDLAQVLAILVPCLANQTPAHFVAVGNGIVELLLLDLRRRCAAVSGNVSGTNAKYVCQFGIKPPQHPLILLLGSKDITSMLFVGAKLDEICQHHDQIIRKNSVEFLRPVFLYIFNNPSTFPETLRMWRSLLKSATRSDTAAIDLISEIISWSKSSTSEKCIYTNSLLLEAIHTLPGDDRFISLRNKICFYLAAICNDLNSFNFDPAENFLAVLSALHTMKDKNQINHSVLLMILADLVQNLAPSYMLGAMRIIRFLLNAGCSRLSRLMVLDGAVQLLGQQTFIQSYLEDCDNILKSVVNDCNVEENTEIVTPTTPSDYWHPDLAKYLQIHTWWTNIQVQHLSLEDFLEDIARHPRFSDKIQLILRGLLYANELPYSSWIKVFDQLNNLSKQSESNCARLVTPIMYLLANDSNPHKRLLLLQNLATMGAKDHVLGVLKALAKDVDRATSLDLYLRLWKAEPRTYPFLYDILKDTSRRYKENPWETALARTYTIREICMIKPQQHGADLVNLFSEILSHPEDGDNEAAVALAIDAIASLCENHVVNIVSTWKVLGFKFTHERRPRIVRSLCKFFANVPSIKVTSLEQERLVNEIITKLWQFVTDFDDREVIVAALESLKSFPIEMMTIFHIPDVFRQGMKLPDPEDETVDSKVIPGECWIQLVQYVNHSAIEEAGNLVAHHIRNEIATFRGGVFLTPEGRPEPCNLKYLPSKSILSAIIHYLIGQSSKLNSVELNVLVLTNLLRIVSQKYSKPIPPLNWCFLHEYFHCGLDMKKHCLRIAINQMAYSGTAKRIVENYLSELVEVEMTEEEVLLMFESLHIIAETVQSEIFRRFVHLALQFLLELSEGNNYKGQDPFGKTIEHLRVAVTKTYENNDNIQYLCEALENLFSRFEVDSKIFEEYIKVLSMLPTKHLTGLLRPSTWIDKRNSKKLQKAIHFQLSIHKYNQAATDLHLLGLSDIMRTVVLLEPSADHIRSFFQRSLVRFVASFGNQRALNEWISELIGHIQSDLAEQQPAKEMREILFQVDVLMIVAVSLSGYGVLLGEDALIGNLDRRLSVFPAALIMVFRLNWWREIENRMYEFIYHMYNNQRIPANYAECFRNALLCCKEQPYFQQSKAWPKFVSLRRS